jgi:hypothetical protein
MEKISQVLNSEMDGSASFGNTTIVSTRPIEEAVAHVFTTGVSFGHTVQRTTNKDEGRVEA